MSPKEEHRRCSSISKTAYSCWTRKLFTYLGADCLSFLLVWLHFLLKVDAAKKTILTVN